MFVVLVILLAFIMGSLAYLCSYFEDDIYSYLNSVPEPVLLGISTFLLFVLLGFVVRYAIKNM